MNKETSPDNIHRNRIIGWAVGLAVAATLAPSAISGIHNIRHGTPAQLKQDARNTELGQQLERRIRENELSMEQTASDEAIQLGQAVTTPEHLQNGDK